MFHVFSAISGLIFLAGVYLRLRLWLSSRKSSNDSFLRPATVAALLGRFFGAATRPSTLLAVLLDGLLFRRLWRTSRQRWAVHASIAWGFTLLFVVGSLGNMAADLGLPLEKDDAWFAVFNDLVGLALLGGVLAAAGRRYLSGRSHPRSLLDDGLVVGLLFFLAAGGFLVEAARYLEEGTPAATGAYAFLGFPLSRAIRPLGLDWSVFHSMAWWIHSLVAFGLVAYMPWSKLLHVFTTPSAIGAMASVASSPAPAGQKFRDFLPVSVAPDGWAKSPVFSPLQMLEMDACTRCGRCLDVCCSFKARADEAVTLIGMIGGRRALFAQEQGKVSGGPGPGTWETYAQGVFSCTLCGRCEEVCPAGIRTRDLAISMRQELATCKAMMPKNLDLVVDAVAVERNIFNFPNDDRALWAEFLDDVPPDLFTKQRAEVLYYVGCVSSFSPAVQEIPQAFLRVLLKAGVDFTLLAGEEWCCGFPLVVGGRAVDAQKLIDHNIEQVKRLGVKTVLFSCPSCYNAWSNYYPLEGVRLMHSTQFIRDLVRQGRLRFEARIPERVTYHDPCDLGRGMGEYAAPREVLRAMSGDNFIELAPAGRMSLCCGGGGDIEVWDAELVGQVSDILTESIDKSGAGLVVDACQQCKRTTQRGLEKKQSGVRVMDIAEVALEYGTFVDQPAARRVQF